MTYAELASRWNARSPWRASRRLDVGLGRRRGARHRRRHLSPLRNPTVHRSVPLAVVTSLAAAAVALSVASAPSGTQVTVTVVDAMRPGPVTAAAPSEPPRVARERASVDVPPGIDLPLTDNGPSLPVAESAEPAPLEPAAPIDPVAESGATPATTSTRSSQPSVGASLAAAGPTLMASDAASPTPSAEPANGRGAEARGLAEEKRGGKADDGKEPARLDGGQGSGKGGDGNAAGKGGGTDVGRGEGPGGGNGSGGGKGPGGGSGEGGGKGGSPSEADRAGGKGPAGNKGGG